MSTPIAVSVAETPRERGLEVRISISEDRLWIDFEPRLPEEAHKVSRVELMAAGALMGIAGVLTGKGAADVLRALGAFERGAKGSGGRRG